MTDPKASGYENAKSLIREVVIERYAYKDLFSQMPMAKTAANNLLLFYLECLVAKTL
ncbi:MAG: hypothetical protein GDA43_04470 [Hormoscilla sp. SP5CHS1]|nr:hypothetical protein [Hormoscilla sp. SP12CHS1]MBC6452535.1 hypothetical protein [Hormoscilla sp. SP5CHS1]MBC6473984.1 hypothetical protein [Hormoscilla sp. GM102CHS1]